MMIVKNMGNGDIYIGFPMNLTNPHSDSIFPPGVKEWLKENKIPMRPGVLKGRQVGIFLNGQDAIAFKLRFSL